MLEMLHAHILDMAKPIAMLNKPQLCINLWPKTAAA